MKKIEYILIVMLLAGSFMLQSCKKERIIFEGDPPSNISTVSGPEVVEIGDQVTFSATYREGSTYEWILPTGFDIVGESDTSNITVKIGKNVVILPEVLKLVIVQETLINDFVPDPDTLSVTVNNSAPVATYSVEVGSNLKDGDKDTLIALFDNPLANPPTFTIINGSGSLGAVKKVTKEDTAKLNVKNTVSAYMVEYTAGAVDGDVEIEIKDAVETGEYGGIIMNTETVTLFTVDNQAPQATISYSTDYASDNMTVTLTATFNEVMDAGTAVKIFIDAPGDDVANQDMTVNPDDSKVWTYEFQPTGGGDGFVTITLGNGQDLAGNTLNTTPGNGANVLFIDNTGPSVSGPAASDEGTDADVKATSDEDGMLYYVILPDGSPVPTTLADFTDNGDAVANGSGTAKAGVERIFTVSGLADGDYDVYFVAEDELSNLGGVSMLVNLSMVP